MIVALLSLPQVFIQVVTLALQPQSLTIQYNEDESKGRVMCDTGLDMKSSLSSYGVWTFLLLVLVLLFMAHTTSRLPSLFNETLVIYESALFSIVLLMLGLGVVFITDDPTTSPTVGYLVQVFSALSIAANTSLRIMMPKLRMVWRDEKVVVSKLVSDHAKHIREEDERFNIKTQTPGIVSGLTPPERKPSAATITTHSTAHSNSPEVADEMVSNFDGGYDHLHTSVLDVDHGDLVDTRIMRTWIYRLTLLPSWRWSLREVRVNQQQAPRIVSAENSSTLYHQGGRCPTQFWSNATRRLRCVWYYSRWLISKSSSWRSMAGSCRDSQSRKEIGSLFAN
jgi:hypothetical protein